jgi:hypothetical protein
MGDNETSFGRTGFAQAEQDIHVNSAKGPALFVGYLESSIDISDASVLARFSGAHGTAQRDEDFSSGGPNSQAFSGTSTILGGALTVKHTFDAIRTFSFQSEYLWRNTEGTRYSVDAIQQAHESALECRQSGWYAQAVTKFALRWRAGLRIDVLQGNEVVEDGMQSDLPTGLPRWSAMVEFNPTEFSRIRFQYNYDHSQYNGSNQELNRMTVHELSLQVNLAIGAHGAHSF